MAFVHDPDRGATDLVILGAQDFTGEPVARVHLPVRVPLGFHGSWIPDSLITGLGFGQSVQRIAQRGARGDAEPGEDLVKVSRHGPVR